MERLDWSAVLIRDVRLCRIAVIAAASLAAASPVRAGLPSRSLALGEGTVAPGEIAGLPLTLTSASQVDAMTVACSWDAAIAQGIDFLPGPAIARAEFIDSRVEAHFCALAVVMESTMEGGGIPPGGEHPLGTLGLRCAAPGSTAVPFVDGAYSLRDGEPPLDNVIVTGGVSIGAAEGLALRGGRVTCVPAGVEEGLNPNGFLRGHAWNLLLPLLQGFDCDGGGESNLNLNWLVPHEIGAEDPRAGDVWDDLNFNDWEGSMLSSFELGGLTLQAPELPLWTSADHLERTFGFARQVLSTRDDVDFKAVLDYLNFSAVPNVPGGRPIPTTDALAVATTYVENRTGSTLPVELCTASSDAIQVWINADRIANVSACRTLEPGCTERTPVCLSPGISKIAVLSWQGEGPWSFRLGILRLDEDRFYTDADALELAFLGSGEGDPTVVGQGAGPPPVVVRRILQSFSGNETVATIELEVQDLVGPVKIIELVPEGWTVTDTSPGTVVEGSVLKLPASDERLFYYQLAGPVEGCEETVARGIALRGLDCPFLELGTELEIRGDSILECSPPVVPGIAFRRGDANGNGRADISDAIRILIYLFLGGPELACVDAADVNDDASLDISDPVFELIYLFAGGPPPRDPGPSSCGGDPTEDDFDCDRYLQCAAADPCSAPGARKTLNYSRGNNDCIELVGQKNAVGGGTYVYSTGTFEIDVMVTPSACTCDKNGDCEGTMAVEVTLKFSGQCAEGDLSPFALVKDSPPSAGTKAINPAPGNPPPNVETTIDEPGTPGAVMERPDGDAKGSGNEMENTAADGAPKVWMATARDTVPCRAGTFLRRFRIVETGPLQTYVDITIKHTKTARCTLATSLEVSFLEFVRGYDFDAKGAEKPPAGSGMFTGLCVKPAVRGVSEVHDSALPPACPAGWTACGPLAGAAGELPVVKHATVKTKADGSKETENGETRNIAKLVSFDCHDGNGEQKPGTAYPKKQ